MEILEENRKKFFKMLFILAVVLCIYLLAKTITEIKNYSNIPSEAVATNTINFDGTGEVSAVPDLATINFTIREDAKNVKDAQTKATAKETAALNFLDQSGIAKKDIQAEGYNSMPQYEYQNAVCPPEPLQLENNTSSGTISGTAIYCPPGKNILTGYEVSEDVSVKIHDLTKAGDIVTGIGAVGISEITGPNFSIENEDALQEQARQIAINDAKAKAAALSKDLGVQLVRIVNFSENGNYPMPMYAMGAAKTSNTTTSAPSPTLPTGENKITSNVTITYEIR
jgi:uncharacterized protein YggE